MSEFLPPVVARLMGDVKDFQEKFGSARSELSETEAAAGSAGSNIGSHIGTGMAVAGAAIGGIGMELTHLGDGLETARKQLEAAGKAAGIDMEELDGITKKADSSMENFGHTSTDTDSALQALVQAGRPAAELNKDMALSADLAAAKHMSLSSAAGLIAKVYGGNSKVLKQFGIDLKSIEDPQQELTKAMKDSEAANKTESAAVEENRLKHLAYDAQATHSAVATEELAISDKKLADAHKDAGLAAQELRNAQDDAADGTNRVGTAIDQLSGKLKGQAAASVDTFGGRMEVAKVKVEDFVAGIGTKVGPAMAVAGPAIGGVGMIVQSGLIPGLISGVGAAVSFGANMIGAGLSAAAAALPVIIAWAPVILAIAAVGLAGYELYKHWDEVFGFVKRITGEAADWVKGHLDLIAAAIFLPFAPLILLVTHWDEAWSFVKSITGEAWSWLTDKISSGVSDVVGFVAGLPGRAVDALASLGGDIAGVASDAMSSMWDATEAGVGDVVGAVSGLPGRAVDALGDLGGWLYGAGRALLEGMINGLESMGGRLADAALSPVRHAVDAVKSFLHIGSPSRLFHGFGVNIGEGLEQGMLGKTRDVADAAAGLASSSVTDFAGMGGGAGGGATMGGLGGGGGTVVHYAPQLVVQTATGDIPDSTMRKIRSQLFGMTDDLPAGSILPAA